MAVKRPWLTGLRPVPGSVQLMALRWLLFVVAALPGLAAAVAAIGQSIGNRPYFTEASDPLPMIPLIRLVDHLPGAVWAALVSTAAVAWLGNLLLTAGAVTLFGTTRGGRPRVWGTVFEAGTWSLWAYLRIALVALVLAAVGTRVIATLAERLLEHGQQAYWTMRAQFLLQSLRGLATLCWLTLVGLFAWWCRVIVIADERHRVRRLWTVVPRLWWRRPFSALGAHFLLALGALLAGAGVLFAWRQSAGGAVVWTLAWLAVLAGLSFLWHWRLRAGRLLWSSPELIDLRAVPDTPWRLAKTLRSRLRRRPRGAPPVTPGTTDA